MASVNKKKKLKDGNLMPQMLKYKKYHCKGIAFYTPSERKRLKAECHKMSLQQQIEH